MHGDHGDAEPQTPDTEAAPQPYAAPALTDLGSFEDLTRFNPGAITDTEGSST